MSVLNQETIECSNEPCNCHVTSAIDQEAYCSDSCRDAENEEEMGNCTCGHPPCDMP